MILTNARLIFPDGIRDGLEVVVEEGRIAEIRERTRSRTSGTIDLGRNYLSSGFVDLHVHGALGRDTMEASLEAFRIICDFHGSGGVTCFRPGLWPTPFESGGPSGYGSREGLCRCDC